jgi:hypothetical protein
MKLNYCSATQNRKRKFDRDRDERDGSERREEEAADPLRNATTLYVGNLYVMGLIVRSCGAFAQDTTGPSTPRRNRFMNCLPSEISDGDPQRSCVF